MQVECKNKEVKTLTIHGIRKISVREVKKLGYKLGDNQIPLGEKPYKYAVLEVKNEDNNREVSFCLLYSVAEKLSIILPNPYGYYVLRPSACLELFR